MLVYLLLGLFLPVGITAHGCNREKVSVVNLSIKNIEFSREISLVVTSLLLLSKFYTYIQSSFIFEKKIKDDWSCVDFQKNFTDLALVDKQITKIKELLYLSRYGTFPEKIFARIYLVKMSLCGSYDKVIYGCIYKLYKNSFDKQGKFIWSSKDVACKAYKNFYKKVPQEYKDLIKDFIAKGKYFKQMYENDIAAKIDNEYNQTLLDIIYEGLNKNYPRLKELCRYGYDGLFDALYDYYMNLQNVNLVDDSCDEAISFCQIVLFALKCSERCYDNVIQECADKILDYVVLSIRLESSEYDGLINSLYRLLKQKVIV